MKVTTIDKAKGAKPSIPLTVRRVEHTVFADLGFAKEHYLTASINPSCRCLLFEWGEVPVAFCAVLNTPCKGLPHSMAISRTVILPAYQGLGLSRVIGDFVGGIVVAEGDDYHLYRKGAHELQGAMLNRNSNWRGTSTDGKERREYSSSGSESGSKYRNRLARKSYSKEYIGKPIEGYGELLRPVSDLRKEKKRREEQQLLIDFGYSL